MSQEAVTMIFERGDRVASMVVDPRSNVPIEGKLVELKQKDTTREQVFAVGANRQANLDNNKVYRAYVSKALSTMHEDDFIQLKVSQLCSLDKSRPIVIKIEYPRVRQVESDDELL